MRVQGLAALVAVLGIACGGGANEEQADSALTPAAAEQAAADSAYSPALFDTISWAADSLALNRGYTVWAFSCIKCHGSYGAGDGGLVFRGDTVRPPTFLAPDWALGEDHEALVRAIFTGTQEGMPHWGVEGLKPRDVDAVAWYIQEVLRRGVEPTTGT